uniref:Uncharacterized protein n=1 Tax=Hyaloperonospora arabidopsidis (strain Emoy2) TaxID=559515 RepID=M4BZ59_HYAAE
MGNVFGLVLGSYESITPPVILPGQRELPKVPWRESVGYGFVLVCVVGSCCAIKLMIRTMCSPGDGVVENNSGKMPLLGKQFHDHFRCAVASGTRNGSETDTVFFSRHLVCRSHVLGSRVCVRENPRTARRGQRVGGRVCDGCSAGSRSGHTGAMSRLRGLCCILVCDQCVYRWQVLVATSVY